jgi:hypothetical protein
MRSNQFWICIEKVLLYGYTLRWLLDSSAIEPHLKNIEPSLQDHRRTEAEPILLSMEEDDAERAEEVQPSTPKDLWESYKDWLKLILIHFTSVERLVNYVTGPHFHYKEIAIKLLVTPYPSSSDHLPSVRALIKEGPLSGGNPKANEDLINFLDSRKPPLNAQKALSKLGSTFQTLKDATTSKSLVTQAIKDVETLEECDLKLPDWDKSVAIISKNLHALQDYLNLEKTEPQSYIKCIDGALRSLQHNLWIFQMLTSDTPRHAGTVHCEASIASFFALSQCELSGPYDNIVEELKVNLDSSHTCYVLTCMSIGLCKNHRNLETVLPDVPLLDQPFNKGRGVKDHSTTPRRRLSQHSFSMRPSYMASTLFCHEDK